MRLPLPLLVFLSLALPSCVAPPGHAAGAIEIPGREAILPSERAGDFFLIEASFGGEGTFRLLLDTGTDYLTLTPETADRVGRSATPMARRMLSANGDRVPVHRAVDIATMELGAVRVLDLHALVLDLSTIQEALGMPIDGLLGIGPFRNCKLILDYPRGQVSVRKGPMVPGPGAVVLASNGASVPTVRGRIAGHDVDFMIDSGCGWSLAVPEAIENQVFHPDHRWRTKGASIAGVHDRTVGRLLGPVELGNLRLRARLGVTTGGAAKIGVGMMRRARITFDLANGVVVWEQLPRRRNNRGAQTPTRRRRE